MKNSKGNKLTRENTEFRTRKLGIREVKLDIMVVKSKPTQKEQELSKLVNSIQAKVDKLKRERKAGKRKEPQSIDIICTEEDIARTKKS